MWLEIFIAPFIVHHLISGQIKRKGTGVAEIAQIRSKALYRFFIKPERKRLIERARNRLQDNVTREAIYL